VIGGAYVGQPIGEGDGGVTNAATGRVVPLLFAVTRVEGIDGAGVGRDVDEAVGQGRSPPDAVGEWVVPEHRPSVDGIDMSRCSRYIGDAIVNRGFVGPGRNGCLPALCPGAGVDAIEGTGAGADIDSQ